MPLVIIITGASSGFGNLTIRLISQASHTVYAGVRTHEVQETAAKAAMDSMAVSYAGQIVRWGIEINIIVPGAFTKGTNHFASMGKSSDEGIAAEYMERPYKGAIEEAVAGLAALEPEDSDPEDVARAIVGVMNLPRGKKPFRVHVDPGQDGAEIVNGMADRVRAEMLRIGLGDILKPKN